MQNPAPRLYEKFHLPPALTQTRHLQELNSQFDDPFDQMEIFDMVRGINDPEYPLTLQQLGVVSYQRCCVSPNRVEVCFTPTIPHCSMAQIIGLMIKVKLVRGLPRQMKVVVKITPDTHVKEHSINKQINDKERILAALENPNIMKVLRRGFSGSDQPRSQ